MRDSTSFSIPDLADLRDALGGLDRLLQATEWEKSAIVRAYCKPSSGGRPKKTRGNSPEFRPGEWSFEYFSSLGYAGLRDRGTVRRYYDAWDQTGMNDPIIGHTQIKPTIRFPKVSINVSAPLASAPDPESDGIRDTPGRSPSDAGAVHGDDPCPPSRAPNERYESLDVLVTWERIISLLEKVVKAPEIRKSGKAGRLDIVADKVDEAGLLFDKAVARYGRKPLRIAR